MYILKYKKVEKGRQGRGRERESLQRGSYSLFQIKHFLNGIIFVTIDCILFRAFEISLH